MSQDNRWVSGGIMKWNSVKIRYCIHIAFRRTAKIFTRKRAINKKLFEDVLVEFNPLLYLLANREYWNINTTILFSDFNGKFGRRIIEHSTAQKSSTPTLTVTVMFQLHTDLRLRTFSWQTQFIKSALKSLFFLIAWLYFFFFFFVL